MLKQIFTHKSKETVDERYLTMERRVSTFPRKRKDEKNLFNTVKGRRHLLHRVSFKIERPDVWKILKNSIKIEHSCDDVLTVFQFCVITFVQNSSMNHIEYVFQLSLEYGVVLTMFMYMLSTFLISMPIYMIFISMASYSKKGPIAFWDCVPLIRGFSISWTLYAIIYIIENLRNTATCIFRLIILSDFHDAMQCKHKSDGDYKCIPAENNYTNTTFRECNYLFATLDFTQGNLVLYYDSKLNIFNTICSTIFLALTIWFAIRGLKAIKKLLQFIMLFAQGIFCFLVIISIITSVRTNVTVKIFSLREDPLFNLKYWSSIIPITMQLLRVGDIIWLGRLKPKKIRPDVFAIILHILRYVYFVLIYCWMMRLTQDIIANYSLNPACMYTEKAYKSHSFLMVTVPDLLFRYYPSGLPCAAWFFVLAVMYTIMSLYCMICVLDGFLEVKNLKHKKKYVSMVIFILGTTYTLLYGYARAKDIRKYWDEFFTKPWLCFEFFAQCTSVIHIYSIKRFMNDYEFTYGTPPNQAWVKMWHGITLYMLVLLVVAGNWLLTLIDEISENNVAPIVYPTILWIIISLPTTILFILHSCKYLKKRRIHQSSLPLVSWGPYKRSKGIERVKFMPERDIKYRHASVTCKHVCLVKLKSYKIEKNVQVARMDKLIYHFDGDLDKYGDTNTSEEEEEEGVCLLDEIDYENFEDFDDFEYSDEESY